MGRRFDLVAYLKLFRFPLVFTAIADSWAGGMTTNHSLQWSTLGLLAVASGGLYLFGMALNDIADRDKDRRSAPGKVIPSGRVSLRGAVVGASVMLAVSFVAILVAAGSFRVQALVVWGCVLLCILAYDLHWVKAPPIMGLVRACNALLGMSVGRGLDVIGPTWVLVALVAPLFGYVTCLTYVSTLEDGPIDRRKVVGGAIGMSVFALLAACVIPLLMATWGGVSFSSIQMVPGLVPAWILVGWIGRRAWKAKERKDVMLVVRDGVAGIILVDAALVLASYDLEKGLITAGLLIPAIFCLFLFKKLA